MSDARGTPTQPWVSQHIADTAAYGPARAKILSKQDIHASIAQSIDGLLQLAGEFGGGKSLFVSVGALVRTQQLTDAAFDALLLRMSWHTKYLALEHVIWSADG
jgi:hypothetical protein